MRKIYLQLRKSVSSSKIFALLLFIFLYTILFTQSVWSQCNNISSLNCPNVVVTIPKTVNFTGNEGGLADATGKGTGFTMVQAHSEARLPEDPVQTFPNIPGYEPSRLNILNGNLAIAANKGIAALNPAASANTNTQINALGIGLQANNQIINIETSLINPVTGAGFAQVGLWYGLDEDNYVKLVVIDNKIEFRIERNAVSNNNISDRYISGSLSFGGNPVKLRIMLDNTGAAKKMRAYYTIGTNAEVFLGELNHTLATGITLSDGITNGVSFAGIFATYRNGTPFTATFDYFKIAYPNDLIFSETAVNKTLIQNQSDNFLLNLTASNAQFPIASLSADENGSVPTWLKVNGNLLDGSQTHNLSNPQVNFELDANGLNPGTYTATVKANTAAYNPATFTVTLIVVQPLLTFSPNQLNFTVQQGGTTGTQNTNLSAEGSPSINLSVANGGNWVLLPANPTLGNLSFGINSNALAPGIYQTSVTATAVGFQPAILNISLEVTPIAQIYTWDYKINFQKNPTPTVVGYFSDLGDPFAFRGNFSGKDFTYGWIDPTSKLPKDNTINSRLRSTSGVPYLLRTLNQLQKPGTEANWEIAVPNGFYYVKIAAGDPQDFNSVHKLNAEGVEIVYFDQNTTGLGGSKVDSALVEVKDGKLTIDAVGGTNSKIQYIWYGAANAANDNIPPTLSFNFEGEEESPSIFKNQVTVRLNAADEGGSGVSSVQYSLNGAAYQNYIAPILINYGGNFSIRAKVVDGNNNESVTPDNPFSVLVIQTSNAKLSIENITKFSDNENYTFSFIQRNAQEILNGPNYDYPNNYNYNHDANVVRLHNTGIAPLVINNLVLSDEINFKIAKINGIKIGTGSGETPLSALLPLVITQRNYADITLIFTTRNLNLSASQRVALFHRTLTVESNDDTNPVKILNLHGIYQEKIENNNEPRAWEMIETSGFKTQTGFAQYNTNHATPIADEIFSPYFVKADVSKPVYVRQISAYHGCCNNTEAIYWQPKSNGANNQIMRHYYKDGQTMLPRKDNGGIAEGTFNPNEAFSIRIAGDNTDPTRNNYQATDANGNLYRGVRIWKAINWNGQIIPNAYIMAHDYLGGGSNFDYNDNMYYFENIKPEIGTAFYSALASGTGIVGNPDEKQSSLEFPTTAIQNTNSILLHLRSLGQTYGNGTSDPFINISTVEIIGANFNEFTASQPLDATLGPGEATTLNVSFIPQTEGIKNAVLLIHYNNADSPLRIPLFGIANSNCVNISLNKRIKAAAINPGSVIIAGKTWESDVAYRSGSFKTENTADNTSEILQTDSDALYRSYLSSTTDGAAIGYNIPATNGKYLLRLHFAENQWQETAKRVQGIYLEGKLTLPNFDIFENVGFKTAGVKDFEVYINDGTLNILFQPTIHRPAINGLELFAVGSTISMSLSSTQIIGANCGSTTGSITVQANNVANGVTVLYKLGKSGTYQSSGLFSNLKAGEYVFYAKEDITGGCEIEALFIVPELNNNITFQITTTPISCGNNSDGTATISNISGGVAPYTIAWNTIPVQNGNTVSNLPEGNFTSVIVTDANGCSKTQLIEITRTLTCPIRINAGGSSYTTADNRQFIQDTYFSAGNTYSINTEIAGTQDDILYQSERWNGGNFGYNIPVVNGNYSITLHFAEIYFSNANLRKFHTDIEGNRVLTNFDIFAAAGGKNIAVSRNFNVNVNDGTLNILLSKGSADNPKISAIEIVYAGSSGNNSPTVGTPIADQNATKGIPFSFTVSPYTFVDVDQGDVLTFSATLANGQPLPAWLSFNSQSKTFSGIPGDADLGTIALSVIAIDNAGASATDDFNLSVSIAAGSNVSFINSRINGMSINNPSSIQFGPDGKLYVSQVNGLIKIFTLQRIAADNYVVTNTEVIDLVQKIPNYNDNGTPNPAVTTRQVLGILITGTAANPVLYVSSNDPRTGGGNGDLNLDTNSGIISKLFKTGGVWEKIDLIRGLPKSEHNHATNGLQISGTTLFIAQGGNVNKGAPSHELAWLPEYAYSAAILSADLSLIEALPTLGTGNNRYKYDLPTLTGVGPFGGNDGNNQAILVQGGPVQIYSPGYRNAYDIVITQAGRMYTWDNSPNAGWGIPAIMTNDSLATIIDPRDFDANLNNLQSTHYKVDDDITYYDGLHYIPYKGYYGGHPNPTRANPAINRFNGLSPVPNGFDFGFPHGTNTKDGLENKFLHPGRPGVPSQDGGLAGVMASTNGISEYRASNFNNQLKGNLLAASFNGILYRVVLNNTGNALSDAVAHNGSGTNGLLHLAQGFGTWNILDVCSQADNEIFPGTIWLAEYGQNAITVLEPVDFNQCNYDNPANNLTADYDGDGYTNGDEIDNQTDPCSPASKPDDWDKDKLSDLNDSDDDNDTILDINDAFALDAKNGTETFMPIQYEWEASAPNAGYILNSGFSGLMINNSANYKNLYNEDEMTVIGTAGFFTIDRTTVGNSQGAANNQDYGFQFGFNSGVYPGKYMIHTAVIQPFSSFSIGDLTDQSMGLFVGKGNQGNYIKIVTDANNGSTGIRVLYELNDNIQSNTLFPIEVLGKQTVHLYLVVEPVSNQIQGAYSFDEEPLTLLGSPINVSADWLTGVLATGILSSSGTGLPINATWGFLRVEPVPSSSKAFISINSGNTIESTTSTDNSFRIENLSPDGQKITKIAIDLKSSVFPDMVFDPNNAIPDIATAKPFTVNNGGASTGYVGFTYLNPHNGNVAYGYDKLEITFTDFDAGEIFEFSIDTDPTSITASTVNNPTGNVSGLELIGAGVSAGFNDGSGHYSQLYRKTNESGASENIFRQNAPASVSISIAGITNPPVEVSNPNQTVKITGKANSEVKVLVLEGGLFLNNLSGGGFDLDAFEANKLLKIVDEKTVVLSVDGKADVPIALSLTPDANYTTGINYIMAVANDLDGTKSLLSNVLTLKLKSGPPLASFRVNTGGSAYTTVEGAAFTADANFTGGSLANPGAVAIENTLDDVLYHTERYGNMSYNFPVTNGNYQVILHFAEIWWGINGRGGGNAVGRRIFNVAIQGQPKLNNYDIAAKTGGPLKAITEQFYVPVTDGQLNINFTNIADNAKISAIEIIPIIGNTPPILANALADKEVPLDPNLTNPFNFTVPANSFTDLEDAVLSYSATLENGDALPDWIRFNAQTRTFSGNGSQYQVNPNYVLVKVTATDSQGLSAGDVFKVSVIDPNARVAIRINAGGNAYTRANGDVFAADTYSSGSSTTYTNSNPIADTQDDVLYQSERWGNGSSSAFNYTIPVMNGNYQVILHFAEIYFGAIGGGGGGAGSRRFNVNIEGQHTLQNFDVFAEAGGAQKAISRTFNVLVFDGVLNLAFTKGASDNPKISAIEIIPINSNTNNAPVVINPVQDISVPKNSIPSVLNLSNVFADIEDDAANLDLILTVESNSNALLVSPVLVGNTLTLTYTPSLSGAAQIKLRATDNSATDPKFVEQTFNIVVFDNSVLMRINAGGAAYTNPSGEQFSADGNFTGGNIATNPSPIANTVSDVLYQSERWGNFSYNLPLNNGQYEVVLHFAETHWGIAGRGGINTGVGSRIFHVDIEGNRKLSNYDILMDVGTPLSAVVKTFIVQVNDGTLNIVFSSVKDNAKVSAIEIKAYQPLVKLSQNTQALLAGSSNKPILRIEVPNLGLNTINSLLFNTIGTSNPNDILKARLYYTSTQEYFRNAVQVGTEINNPSGIFTIHNINQNLQDGVNYFWLIYDINAQANEGNLLDAACMNVNLGAINFIPVISEPLGGRVVARTNENPGTMLDFDGTDDFVAISNEPLFDFINTFSVEAWIKIDQFNKDGQAIITKGNNAWRIQRSGSSNLINFAINNGSGNNSVNSTTAVNDNQWHHIAAVYNGSQIRLYIDGKLEGQANTTESVNNNAYPVFIGENAENRGRYFDGQIDEVRIWNIARSQQQIRENMHLISQGNENGLLSYWQFTKSAQIADALDLVNESSGVLNGGMNAANWQNATEPVGKGASFSANSLANNAVNFTDTGLEVTFGSTHPQGEIVVTRIDNLNPAGPDPAANQNKSNAYWVINNFGNKTGLSAMKLRFYLADGFLIDTSPASYKLYKRASNSVTDWTNQYTASTVSVDADYIDFEGITGFSQAIIAGSGVGLPIRLLSFEAKRINTEQVKLNWQTASEENNKGFELEKSTNAKEFHKIAFVDGAGTSIELKNYTFLDKSATASAYYRLKQIDFDGTFTYSPVVFVEGSEIENLEIYPNPVLSFLKIKTSENIRATKDIRLEVINLNGTILLKESGSILELEALLNRNIPNWSNGMYILRFYTASKLFTLKLIKN